jgi:hypothetical protein
MFCVGGANLGNETVEVGVGGALYPEVVLGEVVDGLQRLASSLYSLYSQEEILSLIRTARTSTAPRIVICTRYPTLLARVKDFQL